MGTTTFQEAWRGVMLSRLSDGALRMVRSTGRLQTLGILIGERKVISAFAVATTKEASKTKQSAQPQMRNGAALVKKPSLFECFVDFSAIVQTWLELLDLHSPLMLGYLFEAEFWRLQW